MRLQKELATLKVAHSELQCQHSTLTSSYGSLKDAHEKQTQLLKETTTRANTADAALHAQREGHAAELRDEAAWLREEAAHKCDAAERKAGGHPYASGCGRGAARGRRPWRRSPDVDT